MDFRAFCCQIRSSVGDSDGHRLIWTWARVVGPVVIIFITIISLSMLSSRACEGRGGTWGRVVLAVRGGRGALG